MDTGGRPILFGPAAIKRMISAIRVHSSAGLQNGEGICFVTGRSKSGTTWVGHILDSHRSVYCDLNENNAFHQSRRISYFDTHPSVVHPQAAEYFKERDLRLQKDGLLYSLASRRRKPFATILADKTPRQDLRTIFTAFPYAKVLVVLRDPRDVLVSLAYHQTRLTNSWQGIFRDSSMIFLDDSFMEEHLSVYREAKDIETYFEYMDILPNQILPVKYEDLKRDTVGMVHRIFSFLGIRHTDRIIKRTVSATTFSKLSGGRSAGEQDAFSFYRKGAIGDWVSHFDDRNRATFLSLGEEQLLIAGYTPTA